MSTFASRLGCLKLPELNFAGYEDDETRKEIQRALRFWREWRKFYQADPQEAIAVLDDFLEDKNHLIALLARLEKLPNAVVRRLVWHENINWASNEAFLRRLTETQIKAIRKAYEELFESKIVPTCLGHWRKWWHGHTVSSLLEAPRDPAVRYQFKGSWTSDMMLIGFGFTAYPEGADDDLKMRSNFEAFRNHVKMVVNNESGIYHWLYRTLRSNILWNENADVQIRGHFCPGIYMTFFCWLFFVFSPFLLLTMPLFDGWWGGGSFLLLLVLLLFLAL